MSQHAFETVLNGKPIQVLMGWDKPLQGYFMVIDFLDSEADEPLWSNLLHHEPAHPKTLDSFLGVLKQFGISIPQAMINEILADGANNVGNKVADHSLENGVYQRIA